MSSYWQYNDPLLCPKRHKMICVEARIRELQQLHDYPRLEVLCDKHKRRRLPTYSGECVDCKKERT